MGGGSERDKLGCRAEAAGVSFHPKVGEGVLKAKGVFQEEASVFLSPSSARDSKSPSTAGKALSVAAFLPSE